MDRNITFANAYRKKHSTRHWQCVTYGRRYSLSAALGLSSEEDDDGNINEKDNKNNKGKKESAKTSEEP